MRPARQFRRLFPSLFDNEDETKPNLFMIRSALFILGGDYHLGDLLWFTAVLGEYRRVNRPRLLMVNVPDRAVNRILEHNPTIDELSYSRPDVARADAVGRFGGEVVVHDLRPVPIAFDMISQWRQRMPWLYYRDLWLEARGQWLATYLGLGPMQEHRPHLGLVEDDFSVARQLPEKYILLAPHVGSYSVPLLAWGWQRLKGWPNDRWTALAAALRKEGLDSYTLGAAGQAVVPGTKGLIGLPIRQVAGVVDQASALVTVESGLWFVASALGVPFIIVRWWLPRSVDWTGACGVPHARIFSDDDSVGTVISELHRVVSHVAA